jgi:hypothetical protein
LPLAKAEDIPIDDIRKLSAQAMEENIHVLQALADYDRRDIQRPWKMGTFPFDPRVELKATIGTISGTIQIPIEASRSATTAFTVSYTEKSLIVSP